MGKFLGNWSDKEDVARDFCIDLKELKGARIIIAWYGDGDYCGSAFVLFRRDGKLYEVNGSHCSCYGLEDQWDPEETSRAALKHRLEHGYMFGGYDDGDAALEAIRKFCSRRET